MSKSSTGIFGGLFSGAGGGGGSNAAQPQQPALGGSFIYPYTTADITTPYLGTPPKSIFDIAGKKGELENQLTTKKNIESDVEFIDNLAPETVELLKLFDSIKFSSNLRDIEVIDKYVKNKLFSNKLDAIINE